MFLQRVIFYHGMLFIRLLIYGVLGLKVAQEVPRVVRRNVVPKEHDTIDLIMVGLMLSVLRTGLKELFSTCSINKG